ncbi:MAG: V-type ATP synthase subunit F [Candidatus Wallbacteria bacterium]|nr:V-type ATP synthase subunit F [Candidatus Wallbacteria bacterium]
MIGDADLVSLFGLAGFDGTVVTDLREAAVRFEEELTRGENEILIVSQSLGRELSDRVSEVNLSGKTIVFVFPDSDSEGRTSVAQEIMSHLGLSIA